jgi:hypothetical protein
MLGKLFLQMTSWAEDMFILYKRPVEQKSCLYYTNDQMTCWADDMFILYKRPIEQKMQVLIFCSRHSHCVYLWFGCSMLCCENYDLVKLFTICFTSRNMTFGWFCLRSDSACEVAMDDTSWIKKEYDMSFVFSSTRILPLIVVHTYIKTTLMLDFAYMEENNNAKSGCPLYHCGQSSNGYKRSSAGYKRLLWYFTIDMLRWPWGGVRKWFFSVFLFYIWYFKNIQPIRRRNKFRFSMVYKNVVRLLTICSNTPTQLEIFVQNSTFRWFL